MSFAHTQINIILILKFVKKTKKKTLIISQIIQFIIGKKSPKQCWKNNKKLFYIKYEKNHKSTRKLI
jgi:hypothetical protein